MHYLFCNHRDGTTREKFVYCVIKRKSRSSERPAQSGTEHDVAFSEAASSEARPGRDFVNGEGWKSLLRATGGERDGARSAMSVAREPRGSGSEIPRYKKGSGTKQIRTADLLRVKQAL